MTKYIEKIKSPEDIKILSKEELELFAYEIRDFLINKVSKTGGHLASNLGVVELTLALHNVFNSPKDKFVWDVGHQSYIHKIITGRAEGFDKLRQFEGLSGFPKKEESPHDIFDSGHSSNSISIGLGLAKARDLKNEYSSVICIIGDGALTGGIAYEALNNAGHSDTNLIVVLNDNEMSISQNIGGISRHLYKLRTAPAYTEIKEKLKNLLSHVPAGDTIYSGLDKVRDAIKYTLVPGIIFEELGFTYLGPVDGHHMNELTTVLEKAKHARGPVLVHVNTKKGKGYKNAENMPDKYHGIGPFDVETGELLKKSGALTYSKVFGNKLVKLANEDQRIVTVTAAMGDGTGLRDFSKQFPNRFYDVGIAEQHAVSFASGLAINGMIPIVAIYSTFLQRAYDQVMMDVCLQKLHVIFCIDRSGIVGEDGETHHGIFDISYLKHIPNLTIMAPKDQFEFEAMLEYAAKGNGPFAIRYPRGKAVDLSQTSNNYDINGKAEILKEGKEACIIAVGRMVETALNVSRVLEGYGHQVSVVNARFIKPLDEETFEHIFKQTNKLITLEDNVLEGGFGDSVSALVQKNKMNHLEIRNFGWPDQYIQQGSVKELDMKYGLDAESIAKRILEVL